MSQAEKSALWKKLKDAGVEFDRPYGSYTEEQLRIAAEKLGAASAPGPVGGPAPEVPKDTVAGLRLNQLDEDEPLRVDPDGTIWYQDEVRKAAFPKPRGRRVYKYTNTGVKTVTARTGEYTETFEMPGDGEGRPAEARITLPSYQVGIYRDPRFPMFKVHLYNERRGFDFFDVQRFYGGADLVPDEIKRVYVENSLCYDMRTTIRAIQAEARERGLLKENAL